MPEAALAAIERHRITHSQWVPSMFVRMLKLPEACARPLRSVLASSRDPRGGAVPGAGQGADDRVVGADRSTSTTPAPRATASSPARARSGWPTRARSGARSPARSASSMRRATCSPAGEDNVGTIYFAGGTDVRIPQRRREDRAVAHARGLEHARRRRLRRCRRMALPDRPQGAHDHLGRGQHLPAGGRESADHPPEGRRRRRHRRARTRSTARK